MLNLYACIRPVQYIPGVPSPVVHPEKMDIVIFRENTEDVYLGIEWAKRSLETKQIIYYLKEKFNVNIRKDSGIGIKPISEMASKRIVRKAIQYAIDKGRKSVTLVHKGNIMKFTKGAFKKWGYEVATEEFGDDTITEEELKEKYGGKIPQDKLVIKDRITDNMFQEVLLRTEDHDVVVITNLNGDCLSDACVAQVGGLGVAPGSNIEDNIALFEATHGTAPTIAGRDDVNPSSLVLSGAMMLEYIGWQRAVILVRKAIAKIIKDKKVTIDLAVFMEKIVKPIKCSEFGDVIIKNMK